MATATSTPQPVFAFLATATLATKPPLARLYARLVQIGPLTIEELKTDLDLPHSTAYDYVEELEELGLVERTDGRPASVQARDLEVTLTTGTGSVTVTPLTVAAIGRQETDEDVATFVERQGLPALLEALELADHIETGELPTRTAAKRLDVHRIEGLTILEALRDLHSEWSDGTAV